MGIENSLKSSRMDFSNLPRVIIKYDFAPEVINMT